MIYLASPYSHPEESVRIARFEQICKIAGALMNRGFIIFCPIAHTHSISVLCKLPTEWSFWMKNDQEMISHSQKLLVVEMDGYKESKGVNAEIAIAKSLGIPIEYINPIDYE